MATCSPLRDREDATGFKDAIDESCWAPLDVHYPLRNAQFHEYILSKLVSEQELLVYNAGDSPAFEVVTLPAPSWPATRCRAAPRSPWSAPCRL
ncbi:unnamed protein product [Urochloa humidicola]